MAPSYPPDSSVPNRQDTAVPADRISVVESADEQPAAPRRAAGRSRSRSAARPQRASFAESVGGLLSVSGALSALGRDMAVDLGTANTLVYVRGKVSSLMSQVSLPWTSGPGPSWLWELRPSRCSGAPRMASSRSGR